MQPIRAREVVRSLRSSSQHPLHPLLAQVSPLKAHEEADAGYFACFLLADYLIRKIAGGMILERQRIQVKRQVPAQGPLPRALGKAQGTFLISIAFFSPGASS